jgi:hypothetical protein
MLCGVDLLIDPCRYVCLDPTDGARADLDWAREFFTCD